MEDNVLVVKYFERFKAFDNTWVVPYFNENLNVWWLSIDMKSILEKYNINYTMQKIIIETEEI